MKIQIDEKYAGRKLLSYLKFTLKISSACITRLKNDPRGLEINGEHVTVRYILQNGDELFINIDGEDTEENTNITPVSIPLDIIYEDENILALNKPPFMPTHPSHNHHDDTLANGVAYMYAERNTPFVFRPIGRLDRNTSGIVILAKNMHSAGHFTRERQNNTLKKSYIAILDGEIQDDEGIIDVPLKRQADSIIIRTVCGADDEGAMSAQTQWKCLYRGHGISLVSVYPKTGRTHQIRVHFAHLGFPILGDDLYGKESEYINRHALHAYSLSFKLPFSDKIKEISASLPEDMARAFKIICTDDIEHYLTDRKE